MTDTKFMERCLFLAKKGIGYVSPNPMVGCVIVKNGKVIAEGFHQKYGEAHAEINALEDAGTRAKGAAMYVNLEPCFHSGKTPPCVDEIIKRGIREVVIGLKDPNPRVAGRSVRKLLASGIKVRVGVLESECRELNKFFLKYIQSGLPYVTLKAGITLDGKITKEEGKSSRISCHESLKYVHRMRSEYDAVLVGRRTVEIDNPSLTVRHVRGRNPVRVVIDRDLKLDLKHKIFDDEAQTIVITSRRDRDKRYGRKRMPAFAGMTILYAGMTSGLRIDLKDAMKKLGKMGIASVLVEGGAETFSEFLRQGLANEIVLFVAPKIFGKGLFWFEKDVPLDGWKVENVEKIGKDVIMKIKN
jgi:diaminohydroxyphosphoribosylaminopyrimidine deaminase/5-amino-6-(5-phosphoribosylamino)uracil reductase